MKLLALGLLILSACVTTPRPQPVPIPEPVDPIEPVDPTPIDNGSSSIETLLLIAGNSKCARVNWSQRGVAPKGYTKGMALAYAKAVCRLRDRDDGFGLGVQPNVSITTG